MTTFLWLLLLVLTAYVSPIVPVLVLAHHLEDPEDRWDRESLQANISFAVFWPFTIPMAVLFMWEDYLDGSEW